MNYLITILIWIIGTFILPLLPFEIGFFPLLDFQEILFNTRNLIYNNFGFLHAFVSLRLLFGFILAVIVGELALLGFKAGKWFIQLFRGSG